MITVRATREGRVGYPTAIGYIIDRVVPFVALPSTQALRRFVRVTNPATGKSTLAIVLDVGPWNEQDSAYVFQPATAPTVTGPATALEARDSPIPVVEETTRGGVRPAAESGIDTRGRVTNGAGIDLSEAVWHALGMTDNTDVSWEFVG